MLTKLGTLWVMTLLLSYSLNFATARPEPTFSDITPMKTQHRVRKSPQLIQILSIEGNFFTSSFSINISWVLLNTCLWHLFSEGWSAREGYGGEMWRSWARRLLGEKNTCGSHRLHLHPEEWSMRFCSVFLYHFWVIFYMDVAVISYVNHSCHRFCFRIFS